MVHILKSYCFTLLALASTMQSTDPLPLCPVSPVVRKHLFRKGATGGIVEQSPDLVKDISHLEGLGFEGLGVTERLANPRLKPNLDVALTLLVSGTLINWHHRPICT